MRPSPPCAAMRAVEHAAFPPPCVLAWALFHWPVELSLWPTNAPLFDVFEVQSTQLALLIFVPLAFDPVRMSCRFGPAVGTVAPFSSRLSALTMLNPAAWSAALV